MRRAGPHLVLGAAQLAVGAAAIFARYALGGAGPIAVSAWRLSIAAFVLVAIVLLRPGNAVRTDRRQALLLAAGGGTLAVHFATWIASLEYTTVAISTLLVASTPIWTALYDAVVLRRPLSRPAFAAFVAGGAGLAMIVGFNTTAPPTGGHALLGAGLALTGSLAFAAYLLLIRSVRAELGTRTIVTHTYSWAAVALMLAAIAAHQPPPAFGNATAWGGILAMALISQLLGHTALNASLRWFSPSTVSFATLLEPVAAAVLAFVVFKEALSGPAIAGGVIVLAAIGIVLREDRATAVVDEAM